MGGDRAALAVGWAARASVGGSPQGHRRDPLEGAYRRTLARDLPERYGPWQTCYDRFVRWRRDGTWERLLAHVQAESDAMICDVLIEVSLDSTVVRAHQHAAGARRLPSPADAKRGHHIRRTRRSDVAGAA